MSNAEVSRTACVAQLVEHFLGKEEVTGSIPVASSDHHWTGFFISGVKRRERYHHFGVLNLQASQLQRDKEQEEANRKS